MTQMNGPKTMVKMIGINDLKEYNYVSEIGEWSKCESRSSEVY